MQAAKAVGAEALLVTHRPDVRYLSGFTGQCGGCGAGWADGACVVYRWALYDTGQG